VQTRKFYLNEAKNILKQDIEKGYTTYNELRKAKVSNGHHVFQDAAVNDLPGYKRGSAPATHLEGPPNRVGTPHYNATQVQNQIEYGGGTLGAERKIAYRALRAGGYDEVQAKAIIRGADKYFEVLGFDINTPTKIPKTRR